MNNQDIHLVRNMISQALGNLYTCLPCEVVTWDRAKQRLKLKIMFQQSINGETVEYPLILEALPMVIRSDKWCLTVPHATGDQGFCIFSKLPLDTIKQGTHSTPSDSRSFDITDAIFIAGLNSDKKLISDYKADCIAVRTLDNTTRLEVKADSIDLTATAININGNITHTGNLTHTGDTLHTGGTIIKGDIIQAGSLTNDETTSGGKSLTSHKHAETDSITSPPL